MNNVLEKLKKLKKIIIQSCKSSEIQKPEDITIEDKADYLFNITNNRLQNQFQQIDSVDTKIINLFTSSVVYQ
jgi:hypothetical protein